MVWRYVRRLFAFTILQPNHKGKLRWAFWFWCRFFCFIVPHHQLSIITILAIIKFIFITVSFSIKTEHAQLKFHACNLASKWRLRQQKLYHRSQTTAPLKYGGVTTLRDFYHLICSLHQASDEAGYDVVFNVCRLYDGDDTCCIVGFESVALT